MLALEYTPGSTATQSKNFSLLVQSQKPGSRKRLSKRSDLGRLSVLRPFA